MVDWYVVAECEWLGPNFGQSEYLDMSGYTEGTMDSQDIQTHGEVGDPFLSYGIDTQTWAYGQAQMEIGLIGSHRIRINSSGVRIWTAGDVWKDPLTAGGGGDLDDLDDVIITTPADNELLAYDNGSSKWINQTPAEAGLATTGDLHSETHVLATTGPHTGTLPWTDLNKTGSNLTDLATRQHAGLTDVTANQHHPQIHYHNGETLQHDGVNSDGGAFSFSTTGTVSFNQAISVAKEIILTEIEEPSTPSASTLKLYAFDESGFTTLRFIEPDGNVIIIGECMYKIGRNTSGSEIARGKLVSFNGTTTGKHPNFSLAKADSLTTMPVIGITCDVVVNNAWARLMIMGRFDGLDTDDYENGDILYASASTAGEMIDVFPPSPLIDQQVGIVEVKHAVTGVVLIDLRTMQGRNDGTIHQSFQIGDGVSGDVTLAFNGDAGNDGSIIYDVSEDQFVFNYDINVPNLITAGLVDGVDVGDLKTAFDALSYYTQAELNGGQLDNRYYTETEIDTNTYTRAQVDAHNWLEADITDLDHLTEGEISLANLLEKNHVSLANKNAHADYQHITTPQKVALHAVLTNLTELATRNHNDLQNIDAGDINHLTDVQVAALHAKQHALDVDEFHTISDLVVFNSSISRHGFLRKLSNVATEYMSGTGVWSTPDKYTQAQVDGLLHAEAHDLASHTTKAHSELTDYNAEANVKHLTDAQLAALHPQLHNLDTHPLRPHDDLTGVTANQHIGNLTDIPTRNHNDLLGLNDGVDYEHITQVEKAKIHFESHSIASHNDTTATGAELETLTDGSETDLHSHAGSGHQYVDRGDLASADFSTVNFTKDGAYHDLDLSGIVPAGTYAVRIQGSIKDSVVGQAVIFRENGNTLAENIVLERTQTANAYHEYDSVVAVDANRVIEYMVSTGMDYINLRVRGWFI